MDIHAIPERKMAALRDSTIGGGWERHTLWSCAPGMRALRRASFDGRT
jgi:hypothetical protein